MIPKTNRISNGVKEFNLIINGVGGQGLITLLRIISLASQEEGYDIKTSELHGLSQRGGSVEVHIRFGKKIYSPLVSQGKANLVVSLELQESLNGLLYSSPKTTFLINRYKTPTFTRDLSEKEILQALKKISRNVFLTPASEICQKKFKTDMVAGIYLLGIAFSKKLLPLKSNSIISAIKKIIPEKYRGLNLKAFHLARRI